jgi:hypothetical protein
VIVPLTAIIDASLTAVSDAIPASLIPVELSKILRDLALRAGLNLISRPDGMEK